MSFLNDFSHMYIWEMTLNKKKKKRNMKISPGIVPAFGVTQISKISFLASDRPQPSDGNKLSNYHFVRSFCDNLIKI